MDKNEAKDFNAESLVNREGDKPMREWEKKDIVDILIAHHKDLIGGALELSQGGDHEGSAEIDNDAIVIEHYLETDHGLEWDGEKFQMGENPYTVDKHCPTTKEKN